MSTTPSFAQGHVPSVLVKDSKGDVVSDNSNKEKDKYQKLWGDIPEYRNFSPGEQFANMFLQQTGAKPGEEVIDFGCGTGKGSLVLAVVGRLKTIMVDFTDNCLDEDIKKMLTTQAHVMKFIQADLEKPVPVAAKYGYCTDVMEHIPPEKVDDVLDNILKAAQHVFFAISTVPDHFGQTIGEQLHLTVKPYEWWLKKLRDREATVHWTGGNEHNAFFYCSAWTTGADVVKVGRVNTEDKELLENIKINLTKGYRECVPHNRQEQPIMILGGAPSLADYWDEIIEKRKGGEPMVTINGTYLQAIEKGLKPSAQIIVDAREFNKRFVVPDVDICKYLIASQAHPETLKACPKDRTFMWHACAGGNDEVAKILDEHYEPKNLGWFPVPGGSTAMLRGFALLRMLGFWKFEVYGFDSCLKVEDVEKLKFQHHAYEQTENDSKQIVTVTCGGRVFYCHPWMVSQAEEFMDQVKMMGDEVQMIVYGDGLISHIIKTGAELAEKDTITLI